MKPGRLRRSLQVRRLILPAFLEPLWGYIPTSCSPTTFSIVPPVPPFLIKEVNKGLPTRGSPRLSGCPVESWGDQVIGGNSFDISVRKVVCKYLK
jgi:hypothetical protein